MSLDVRDEDLPPRSPRTRRGRQDRRHHGHDLGPAVGEKIPRPTFSRLCEKAGATTASSVSSNTDMLICGADVGASKTAKAEKLEVAVVDQSEIWEQLIAAGIV